MKKQQIIQVFTDWHKTKQEGLWFSGIRGVGVYKSWHDNSQLAIHCNYKEDLGDGEYKQWHRTGRLFTHKLYKKGKVIKDYLK